MGECFDNLPDSNRHEPINVIYQTAELKEISNEISTIAVDCLLYLSSESIGEVHDLTYLFRASGKEESG